MIAMLTPGPPGFIAAASNAEIQPHPNRWTVGFRGVDPFQLSATHVVPESGSDHWVVERTFEEICEIYLTGDLTCCADR